MMQKLIGVLLIIGVLLGLKELHRYWEDVKEKQETQRRLDRAPPSHGFTPPATPPDTLPGLPPSLESSLAEAKQQGPAALKLWLDRHRSLVRDPRLADIELDYVLLLGARNFTEARKIFTDVQSRTPPDSPVFPRVQQLQRHYQ